ncbi:exopolysaccharide biosynthesis polyprenyl glycosylphosphotransferase [Paractinoplanes lichenicola]|uniref:Exopolysaccharide biosynthesis polyprenyl glycosylphosphotransferase n=1 Tax=Paractinoplanes lichenicola TaxID=2802976 RepID=A0ABS1W6E4_9ACTN|nr:exopolysaccharide biosynthesis polyprenyl glycosylphosphotransferase [Actinoplanes lichenicola]MBL7262309.1 exopolysaccharide biosynthesis polyprenyl glycosylphosphotransferase [Actinoplanes lichenicola]
MGGIEIATLVSVATIGLAAVTESLTWYEAPAAAAALCAAIFVIRCGHPFTHFLPLAKRLVPASAPLVILLMTEVSGLFTRRVHIPSHNLAAVCLIGSLGIVLLSFRRQPKRKPVRIALLGNSELSTALAQELAVHPSAGQIVGFVGERSADPLRNHDYLGPRSELPAIVEENGIDLLLVSSEEARRSVFELLAADCLDLKVRVLELASFYEDTFGLTPLAAIEPRWLESVLHPSYRQEIPWSKRILDVVVSLVAGLIAIPVLIPLVILVKLDGGPALYRQIRIGERGRPFEILKLRSMRSSDERQQWSSRTDPRVTWIGKFMRRTHLDELPQIVNVLRGDMSIVGPRPEQPALAERLRSSIPYYDVRHLVRPGLTGWAQVRGGYAGSDDGSVLKVCYDLYYIKHRSFSVDCVTLVETVRTLVFDRQWQNAGAYLASAFPDSLRGLSTQTTPFPPEPSRVGVPR